MKTGEQVVLIVDGTTIKGKFYEESREVVILIDKDNTVVIPKSKISATITKGKPEKKEATSKEMPARVTVLGCSTEGCRGVRFTKVGSPDKEDFKSFMSQCPCVGQKCKCMVVGSIDQVPKSDLKKMFDGTLFGEYPRHKE